MKINKRRLWMFYDYSREDASINAMQQRVCQPVKTLITAARYRAKKKGMEFSITWKDIEIPETCPLLGLPLSSGIGKGSYNDMSPSLDRIDNDQGYTKDNTWVISRKANVMKNSATLPELVAFAKNVVQYFS